MVVMVVLCEVAWDWMEWGEMGEQEREGENKHQRSYLVNDTWQKLKSNAKGGEGPNHIFTFLHVTGINNLKVM